MATKQLNIRNKTYYFDNDLINVLNFEANNLKLDRKSWKCIDIYYIGYVEKDKSSNWSVNNVNPLYLIANKVYGYISEKNGIKFLSIDKGDAALKKYDQVFSGIKYHIGKISGEEVVYNSSFDKIKFLTDDSLSLGKLIYFPTLTVVIRCAFKQDGVFYPQVYSNDCLYQL